MSIFLPKTKLMKTYLFRKVTKTPEGQIEEMRAVTAETMTRAQAKAGTDHSWESVAAGEMCASFRKITQTQDDGKIEDRIKRLSEMTDDELDDALAPDDGLDAYQNSTVRWFISELLKP